MGRQVFSSATASDDEHGEMRQVAVVQPDNSRIVTLHGEVNEYSISLVIMQLLQLANINQNPIYLVISTYGGAVDEMFGSHDRAWQGDVSWRIVVGVRCQRPATYRTLVSCHDPSCFWWQRWKCV